MGVDTYIFDKVSKECFYFDRNYNFFAFADRKGDEIYDKVMYHSDFDRKVDVCFTAKEIEHCCDINIDYWKKNEQERINRVGWNEAIAAFVADRPNGRFFFRNDHQEPDSHSLTKKYGGEYTEVGGD